MGGPWSEGCWLPEPLVETFQLLPPEEPSFYSSYTQNNTVTSAQVSPNIENESQLLEESALNKERICDSSSDNKLCSDDFIPSSNFAEETCCIEDISEIKSTIKERHISVDSARDSGIGEGSNLPDGCLSAKNEDTMKNLWEPKVKHSLAERLPKHKYYLVPPSRYIFPGAEVYYDPDEKYGYSDEEEEELSETESTESESDKESDNGESKFGTNELEKFNKFVSNTKTSTE